MTVRGKKLPRRNGLVLTGDFPNRLAKLGEGQLKNGGFTLMKWTKTLASCAWFWGMALGMYVVGESCSEEEKTARLQAAAVLKQERQGCQKEYRSLAISPDGKRLYALARLVAEKQPGDPRPLAILECWQVTHTSGELVWSVDINGERHEPNGPYKPNTYDHLHEGKLGSVLALSPDGKLLALGTEERVKLWDTAQRKMIGELSADLEGSVTDRCVKGISFSPNGKYLVGFHSGQKLHIWELASKKTFKIWNAYDATCNSLLCAQFASDDQTLAVAGIYARIAFWDWKKGRRITTWDLYDYKKDPPKESIVYDLAKAEIADRSYWITAHGDWLMGSRFEAGESSGKVEVRNSDGRLLWSRKVHGAVLAVAVSPDGRCLASTEYVKSWQVRPVIPGQPVPRRPLLDYFDWPSSVYLWETETGKQLAVLEGHQKGVTDVVWLPTGRGLASCSIDGTIRLWQAPK